MLIADPRGGLWAGLVIEALLVAMSIFAMIIGVPVIGMMLLATFAWGGLIALWFAFSVRLIADEKGVRGRIGFSEVDFTWSDVSRIQPLLGQLRIELSDGSEHKFRVPNTTVGAALERLTALREGVIVRVIDVPPPRYAIPRGIETYLALEKKEGELLCVNVLVGGNSLANVAKASRILAVRAADENRWDASFTGRIRILVSELRTPVSPELAPLMEAALEGARDDLKQRGWTVVGGKAFELSWKLMGPSSEPGKI